MTIKNYKTITITQVLTHINTFSVPINIPFNATHFYVKNICSTSYNTTQSNDTILLLKTSLYNNNIICSLPRQGINDIVDINNQSNDLKYQLNGQTIIGNYDFTFTNIAGGIPDEIATNIIEVAITLLFEEQI